MCILKSVLGYHWPEPTLVPQTWNDLSGTVSAYSPSHKSGSRMITYTVEGTVSIWNSNYILSPESLRSRTLLSTKEQEVQV